jgi:hypothetical protein
MNLFEHPIRLNNEGIAFMAKEKDEEAIDCLLRSIKLMKKELIMKASTMDEVQDHNQSTSSDALVRDQGNDHSTFTVPGMDDGQNCIFAEAITFPQEFEIVPDEQDIQVYSAAIIFNLALVFHAKGKRGGEGNSSFLIRAEKLYVMVLKVITCTVHARPNRTSVLVKLGSINNLSQIRYERGEFDHSQEGRLYISNFLNTSGSDHFINEPNIQGLLINVLLLKAPKVAPAA